MNDERKYIMMKYYLTGNKKTGFNVVEVATEYTIMTYFNENEARKFMKFLNRGGSWNGWTPSFFLIKMPEIKEI
jgi:hypothetical protein